MTGQGVLERPPPAARRETGPPSHGRCRATRSTCSVALARYVARRPAGGAVAASRCGGTRGRLYSSELFEIVPPPTALGDAGRTSRMRGRLMRRSASPCCETAGTRAARCRGRDLPAARPADGQSTAHDPLGEREGPRRDGWIPHRRPQHVEAATRAWKRGRRCNEAPTSASATRRRDGGVRNRPVERAQWPSAMAWRETVRSRSWRAAGAQRTVEQGQSAPAHPRFTIRDSVPALPGEHEQGMAAIAATNARPRVGHRHEAASASASAPTPTPNR